MLYISCSLPVTLSNFDGVACEEREDEADTPDVDITVPLVVDGGPVPKGFNIQNGPINMRLRWFFLLLQPFKTK